ncbi:hypothetical protein GJ699_02260 [Duganella sp. FT80W]|uniref:Uncharacterized protein n=1 Tax=Duganella guangzhouensis TaxID=2666084 RepID=A0A6I2KWK9_9BURK|nr:zinc ribbon domain-containing protein [Duganella guangzhouensis]MRW88804.1 hypothetical protein [Duganella guangzhouensis]
MSDNNENEPLHDNLRDLIGQAISDEIAAGAEQPDWCDSREIDRLADAVLAALRKEAPAPRLDLNIVIDDTLPADTAVLEAGGQSVALVGLGGAPAVTVDSPEFNVLLGKYAAAVADTYQATHAELTAHIETWQRAVTAQAVVAERERAARLALQWSNARMAEGGGYALRNYAQALRDGVDVDERDSDYHWSKSPAAAQQPAPALPDLTCVIHWLENGCDPLNAAKELRAYQKQMGLPDVAELPARQHAQPALSEERRHLLHTVIDCCEILNKRPRPMCRDCADEDGTCPHGGLQCDMDKLFADARAILATSQSAPVAFVPGGVQALADVTGQSVRYGDQEVMPNAPADSALVDAGPRYIANPDDLQTKILHAMYRCAQRGDTVERMHFDVCQVIAAQPSTAQGDAVGQDASKFGRFMRWEYCPECGCLESSLPDEESRTVCAGCGQEWYTKIDYSGVVRTNLQRLVQRAASKDSERDAALPAAVIAWHTAEKARIEAVGKYNGKLAAAKEHDFPGPDVSAEFKVMTDTGNAAHRLLRPMYEAIAAIAAQQSEKGGA